MSKLTLDGIDVDY